VKREWGLVVAYNSASLTRCLFSACGLAVG
jgi:hypothetical protein